MKKALFLLFAATCLVACKHSGANTAWLHDDDVRLAVDETFQPVMAEELDAFGKTHPEATMLPLYCSEDSALRLLMADTLRTIVVTRRLTDRELKVCKARRLDAQQAFIATDAFALIVNKADPDTVITLDEVRGIANGTITRWDQIRRAKKRGEVKLLFDKSGSSTVRYMRDSLCGGKDLRGNVFAQGSTQAVIDMVRSTPGTIGVVGTDWLRGAGDAVLKDFDHLPVSVMYVQRDSTSYHRQPYQYYIGTGEYPLCRGVYVITTDPRTRSQEKYLFFFLKGQQGQRIFCDYSQLLPSMQVQVRSVNITE